MLPEGTIYRSLTKLIWISLVSRRYPSIVVHAQEERGRQLEDGSAHPVDTSLPNPNSIEFDNLYLDMNGIIHPCCHPEDRPAPRNEEEMMLLIFEYIDRLFNICRPRRLLYMAIDGVAPRAKMNQQRSRRFRSSKEAGDKEMEMEKAKQRLLDQGLQIPEKALADDEVVAEKFDSNCITPGTEFMANLARNLRYYVHNRLNNDPGWAGISVILSDANVPGEGEHKIMDFIRKQRSNPDHDPNTQHCLCGADADLIMLGLATHEVNFSIIREEFKPNAPRPCELCGQVGHDFKQCTGKSRSAEDEQEPATPAQAVEFIFLRLSVLREYLEKELKPDVPWTFGFDLERAIDDWVFMCFFVGNDFLPHLPSLEIREGAIDRLIDLYKRNAERNGGYLTENGFVDMQRCQVILYELGKMEDSILKNRMEKSKFERRRDRQRAQQNKRRMEEEEERSGKRRRTNSDAPAYGLDGAFAAMPVSRSVPSTPIVNARETVHNARVSANHYSTNSQNLSSAQQLRKFLVTGEESAPPVQRASSASSLDRTANGSRDNLQDEDEDPNDVVRLGEDGWKQRYYLNKFAVEIDRDSKFQSEIVFSYVEGLCWVLQYYYQGCPSWTWYYPYHYSPFASDFINIIRLKIEFPLGTKPFKPLEQLMGVFPEASGVFLPTEWRKLMGDPDSEILDFYPTDFSVDLNGKKFAWQGVALLPFVDENRLLRALARVYDTLTAEEQARNCLGESVLFVGQPHKIFPVFQTTFFTSSSAQATSFQPMSSSHIFGMAGLVSHDADAYPVLEEVEGPFASMPTIAKNKALSVLYRDPGYEEGHKYQAIRLAGAKDPVKVLTEGRVQLGYDPNRRQMRLSEGAQRMVGGAVRGMDRHSYGGNGYEGGRGRGGGGGRGGYENRNGWNAQRDERRGYNEEREPRWEDNPNRFRDRDSQQYSRRDQYNQGSGSSYGGYSGGNEEFNRYDNRRSDYNNRDTHYSNQSANGRYPSGRDSYSNQPHSYPDYQQGYNQSQSGYSPYQSRSALQMPPPRQPQYPPSSDSSQTRYYTSNYRRSN